MRKPFAKLLPVALAATIPLSLAACGGSSDTVKFWAYGSIEELSLYTALVNEFNDTYGEENGIHVSLVRRPVDNYFENLRTGMLNPTTGPDIGFIYDDELKKWVYRGDLANVQEYVDAHEDLYEAANYYPTVVDRYRIDLDTNTSNKDDPLWGIPYDTQPTSLFYNEDVFKAVGIKMISVPADKMNDWNNNNYVDGYGKKKSDLGISVNVPKKGYFRSETPYVSASGEGWEMPSSSEVLVFNNQIAMNWDEVEDLSFLLTKEWNTNSPTIHGYFTEWWFNYGWSVGGDCLTDLTGSGKWNFSLLDPNPNYIVKDGQTFTGNSGKVYQAGESIPFYDKMDVQQSQMNNVKWTNTGTYTLGTGGPTIGIRSAVANSTALMEVPSTREAFIRYIALGTKVGTSIDIDGESYGGLGVSPNPNQITDAGGRVAKFTKREVAIIAETAGYMADVAKVAGSQGGFNWNVAPLAQYKEYNDPTDPQDDTLKAYGSESGHSNAKLIIVNEKSSRKEAAVQFALWCGGPKGQEIRTSMGYLPTNADYVDNVQFSAEQKMPQNAKLLGKVVQYQGAGDWMYMPDYLWVQEWCVDLNAEVRNGTMTFAAWYKDAITDTNNALVEYEKFQRNDQ